MRIIIRVDSSTQIGTGHVMRCLTFARALKERKHHITFICRDFPGNLTPHIKQLGFDVINLNPLSHSKTQKDYDSHTCWTLNNWYKDANECRQALNNTNTIDWLIVDHYALDMNWEKALNNNCKHIMVIDDLANREHIADILLDQNLCANMDNRYSDIINEECLTFLGPKYALLREEFTKLRPIINYRTKLEKILVFFGGADDQDLTSRTIAAIQQFDINIHADIIIGAANPHQQNIEDLCAKSTNIKCHTSVNNISKFMFEADLAIGAGGSTTWERCYMGLPAIVFTIAPNQIEASKAVSELGACLLFKSSQDMESQIITSLQKLITSPKILSDMSLAAYNIMEGHLSPNKLTDILETFA